MYYCKTFSDRERFILSKNLTVQKVYPPTLSILKGSSNVCYVLIDGEPEKIKKGIPVKLRDFPAGITINVESIHSYYLAMLTILVSSEVVPGKYDGKIVFTNKKDNSEIDAPLTIEIKVPQLNTLTWKRLLEREKLGF